MSKIELIGTEDGTIARLSTKPEGSRRSRGVGDSGAFDRSREVIAEITREVIEAIEPASAGSKEVVVEMAFELTSGLDLKIVKLGGSATMKVTVKI